MVYDCIVVGFDGSSASKRAVVRGIELASRFGAHVYIVTVVPKPWMALGEMLSPVIPEFDDMVSSARQGLEKLVEEVREMSGYDRIEAVVVEGEPAEALLDFASEHQCGLVVVGRRGASRLEYLLVGSVSSRVISLARDIDVLVVH